ncbi:polysaccharide deacetylase family protein [Arthrobacter wenxiniae]|jgi:peptidoglycan/xylan/chitin deacetylase (PgdA/CDA1 family)|uniref:Polysaccharide deacetylase family protein n=1 Tax=Arthrobacter wenxiniae TaxID=2713570 RepID=A0A7Y7LYZ3_9MICC|nr:polysaccharide deacetylase family protein [Arthrobacter wenxiniae]NVM95437.1 polysaccharide deacetylase family protein [Arthrobacter wenxiniae]
MPHHLRTATNTSRWIVLGAVVAVLAALAVGALRLSAGVTTAPGAATAAATAAAAGPGATGVPASSAPAADTVDPRTGRHSTLGTLVPDYTLPPIENGMVPVITSIPTGQKVVFLTIDDGAVKRESDLALLEKNGIKASLFLAHTFIAGHAAFYHAYLNAGYLIEDHTMTHNLGFIGLPYDQVKAEICGMADYEEKYFGRRPVLFRPPGGPYTEAVRRAAAECGMRAIVDWKAKANARSMQYQVGGALRPGDIVLIHFRPEFPADLAAFMKAQKAAGLKVVLLEDYLGVK